MNVGQSRETLTEYVARWQRLAPQLQKVRDADIRTADTAKAMRIYRGSASWAAHHRPPRADSGLVEQQRWFQQLRAGR
jgi:hypothetical protein